MGGNKFLIIKVWGGLNLILLILWYNILDIILLNKGNN